MSEFIDYYAVLGIPSSATDKEIKQAYRKIAKECHPDLFNGLSEEEQATRIEKFKKANDAHEVLGDAEKRASYDIRYKLHQEMENRSQETDDVPFWEKPDWGNDTQKAKTNQRRYDTYHTETNQRRYDTRQEQYNTGNYEWYEEQYEERDDILEFLIELKNEILNLYYDVKEDEYSIRERFRKYKEIFKEKNGITILGKGFMVFGNEFLYSAGKLKLKRRETVGHYIMKNRGKALVATGLVIALATGVFSGNSESKPISDPVTNKAEELLTEPVSPTITITRTYTVGAGDTLSGLAEDANCTRQEIKNLNDMNSDVLYYKDVIEIPYHIPEDEIGKYTTVELYQGESLYDFAESHETNPESLQKLNSDTIIEVNGSYAVTSDTIVTPTFAPYDYSSNKTK